MINFSLRGQLEECQGQLYDQLVPNYKSLTGKVCSKNESIYFRQTADNS